MRRPAFLRHLGERPPPSRRFDMKNQLIFDLQDAGYPWQCLAAGLLIGALLGLAALSARLRSELRLFCTVCASLFVLWMGVIVSTIYPAYSSLIDAGRSGNVSVIEGTVSNFHPGGGFSKERFCVDNRSFQYTPETVPVSFTNSPLQGGPIISNGLRVRIASPRRAKPSCGSKSSAAATPRCGRESARQSD